MRFIKWSLAAVLLCLGFSGSARAQCPSQTPNLGLQVPNIGNTSTWGTCLNLDLTTLDNLLGGIAVLPSGTTTPVLATPNANYVTANTGTEAITNILDGYNGQTIRVICGSSDTFTSFVAGATIALSGPWSCPTGKTITLTLNGTVWTETARGSANASTISNCNSTTAGLVPTPPNDPTQFLNGQCTFSVPAGFGALSLLSYASGSRTTTTVGVGGIASGSTSGPVTSCIDFVAPTGALLEGIFIAGAGAASADFIDPLVSCVGTTATWTHATSTTVTAGALVQHDDTAGVQAAVNACYAVPVTNSCVLFAPDGLYRINGALQTPAGSPGYRIFLPQVTMNGSFAATSVIPTIEFHGQTTPANFDSTSFTPTGASFVTQESGGCMMGGYNSSSAFGQFTMAFLKIEQMSFFAPDNPNTSLVCAGTVWYADIDHCEFGTTTVTISQPTHATATGVILPLVNNGNVARFTNSTVYGFYTGLEFSEDAYLMDSAFAQNQICLKADSGYHSAYFGIVDFFHCPFGLLSTNGGSTGVLPITISQLRIEDAPASPAWEVTQANIYDPQNILFGSITWHAVLGGVGPIDTLYVNGAGGVQFIDMLHQTSYTSPINNSNTGSGGTVAAFSNPLHNPSVIVASVLTVSGATITGCTDTAGNTYVDSGAGAAVFNSSYNITIWRASNTHTTANNVVTCAGSAGGTALAVEFVGFISTVDGTPKKVQNQTSTLGPNALTITSQTTSMSGDLIIAAFGALDNLTPGNVPINFSYANVPVSGLLLEYYIQPVAGAIAPTAGDIAGDPYAGIAVALEP